MWWFVGAIIIGALAVSPLLPLALADLFGFELDHDSTIATMPWLLFYTMPAGLLAMIVWTIFGLLVFVLNRDL